MSAFAFEQGGIFIVKNKPDKARGVGVCFLMWGTVLIKSPLKTSKGYRGTILSQILNLNYMWHFLFGITAMFINVPCENWTSRVVIEEFFYSLDFDLIITHVHATYLACWGQKYAIIRYWGLLVYLWVFLTLYVPIILYFFKIYLLNNFPYCV